VAVLVLVSISDGLVGDDGHEPLLGCLFLHEFLGGGDVDSPAQEYVELLLEAVDRPGSVRGKVELLEGL
jgi:hypothetical protein